jgi:hypothetical protein
MKTLTPNSKQLKAANSLNEMLRGMDAFLPKTVRIQKETFSDWGVESLTCTSKSKKNVSKNSADFEV